MPAPENYGFVLGLDSQGRVGRNLQDPSGAYAQVSSEVERGGFLCLGSIADDEIGRIRVP